jgi:hypothetical protein
MAASMTHVCRISEYSGLKSSSAAPYGRSSGTDSGSFFDDVIARQVSFKVC